MKYKIGAHQSTAGGYDKALDSISDKGGNCLQIFASSPFTWQSPLVEQDKIDLFVEKKQLLGIDPVYFHACYLLNCADQAQIATKTRLSLIEELKLAKQMQVRGSIIHTGSFKGGAYSSSVSDIIKEILAETPEETFFIIENAGNNKIGKDIKEIARIMEEVNNDRVRVCLDTCHLHAAGYDLSTEENIESFLQEFDRLIGIYKLEVIHLNDSKDPFNSSRDRHENLGQGQVGIDVFKHLINHPKLETVPFILETPGFDGKGPDKQNIDILKSMLK
ncbi:MAG: deoxyribonuclease IV [Weeksellaceae bacterium]